MSKAVIFAQDRSAESTKEAGDFQARWKNVGPYQTQSAFFVVMRNRFAPTGYQLWFKFEVYSQGNEVRLEQE